jgi:hypothetical protein
MIVEGELTVGQAVYLELKDRLLAQWAAQPPGQRLL